MRQALKYIRPGTLMAAILLASVGCAGMPEMHRAVHSGDSARLQSALRNKDGINAFHGGRTPLHIAAEKGDVRAARMLLEAGAIADAPVRLGARGAVAGTALILAVSRGDSAMTRLLLESGAKVDAPGWNGLTPLMEAARMGRPGFARLLMERGALVNRTDEDGRTALIWAALTGRASTARLLMARGADPALKDIRGKGPGDYARSANHGDVLLALRASSNPRNRFKIRKKRR